MKTSFLMLPICFLLSACASKEKAPENLVTKMKSPPELELLKLNEEESMDQQEAKATKRLSHVCESSSGKCAMKGEILIYERPDKAIELKVATITHIDTCDGVFILQKSSKGYAFQSKSGEDSCFIRAEAPANFSEVTLEVEGCNSYCGMQGFFDGKYR